MPFKTVAKYLSIICLCLIIGAQAVIIGLPLIAESIIFDVLIKERFPEGLGGFTPEFSIEKIGLANTIIRDIKVGKDVHADLAELSYTLTLPGNRTGKSSFRLNKVTVRGLTLSAEVDAANHLYLNGLSIPFNDIKSQDPDGQAKTAFPVRVDLNPLLPFIPGQVSIKNSRLNITYKNRKILIPLEIMARIDAGQGRATARGRFRPFGQAISAIVTGDLETGITDVEISGTQLSPDCLTGLIREKIPDMILSGPMDLNLAYTRGTPLQFRMSGLGISGGNLPQVKVHNINGQVAMPPGQAGGITQFTVASDGRLSLSGRQISETGIKFDLNAVRPAGNPVTISLRAETLPMDRLEIKNDPKQRIVLSNPGLNLSLKGTLDDQESRIRLSGQSFVHRSDSGTATFRDVFLTAQAKGNLLALEKKKTVRFESHLKGIDFSHGQTASNLKKVNVSGTFQVKKRAGQLLPVTSGQLRVSAKGIGAALSENRISSAGITVNAKVKPDRSGKKLRINLDSAATGIIAASGTHRITAPEATASGHFIFDKSFTPSLKLDTRLTGAKVDIPAHQVTASGIRVRLPVTYPFRPDTGSGILTIGQISDGGRVDAGLSAVFNQTGNHAFSLKGAVKSRNIEGLILDFDLNAGLDSSLTPEATVFVKTDSFEYTETTLSTVIPEMEIPGRFSINASAETRAALKKHVLETAGLIRIHGGSLNMPDMDLKVDGITGNIAFSDLLNPESLPGQMISVKSIKAGQFRFSDAGLRFSVEHGKSLNIENLKFKWCNGLVSTESIRLPDRDNRFFLTLYCDRLEMDSLLRQIGAFDAEGGGTLSGRIPVVYNNGDISFDNGFLFSTPGRGGRIFVNDLDRMLEGFPRDTPEFSQLDLAGEALKDFRYQWAKLRLNTSGDTLDVKMELDGKPAKILPFEYRKDINSFMRVDAKSPGSRFQGVKLDVNLKLPFNRVMKFGNNLKSILD